MNKQRLKDSVGGWIKYSSTLTNIWSPGRNRTNCEFRCTQERYTREYLFLFPFQFLFKKVWRGSKVFNTIPSKFLHGTSDKLLPLTCFAKLALLLVPALFPELWPPPNFDSLIDNARNDKPIAAPWSIQRLHCALTSVWSLLVNHAEQPSLSDPVSMDKMSCFRAGSLKRRVRGIRRRSFFSFSISRTVDVRGPLKKKKEIWNREGERVNEFKELRVQRVFIMDLRCGTAREKGKGRSTRGSVNRKHTNAPSYTFRFLL